MVLEGATFRGVELWVEWGKRKMPNIIDPAASAAVVEKEAKRLSESNALADWLQKRIGDQYPRYFVLLVSILFTNLLPHLWSHTLQICQRHNMPSLGDALQRTIRSQTLGNVASSSKTMA